MKIKDNLSNEQRKALKEIQQIKNKSRFTHWIKIQDLLLYQREMQLKT